MTNTQHLHHRGGCTSDRTETTTYPDDDRVRTVTRCIDCAGQTAIGPSGDVVAPPSLTGPMADIETGAAWEVEMRKPTRADVSRRRTSRQGEAFPAHMPDHQHNLHLPTA